MSQSEKGAVFDGNEASLSFSPFPEHHSRPTVATGKITIGHVVTTEVIQLPPPASDTESASSTIDPELPKLKRITSIEEATADKLAETAAALHMWALKSGDPSRILDTGDHSEPFEPHDLIRILKEERLIEEDVADHFQTNIEATKAVYGLGDGPSLADMTDTIEFSPYRHIEKQRSEVDKEVTGGLPVVTDEVLRVQSSATLRAEERPGQAGQSSVTAPNPVITLEAAAQEESAQVPAAATIEAPLHAAEPPMPETPTAPETGASVPQNPAALTTLEDGPHMDVARMKVSALEGNYLRIEVPAEVRGDNPARPEAFVSPETFAPALQPSDTAMEYFNSNEPKEVAEHFHRIGKLPREEDIRLLFANFDMSQRFSSEKELLDAIITDLEENPPEPQSFEAQLLTDLQEATKSRLRWPKKLAAMRQRHHMRTELLNALIGDNELNDMIKIDVADSGEEQLVYSLVPHERRISLQTHEDDDNWLPEIPEDAVEPTIAISYEEKMQQPLAGRLRALAQERFPGITSAEIDDFSAQLAKELLATHREHLGRKGVGTTKFYRDEAMNILQELCSQANFADRRGYPINVNDARRWSKDQEAQLGNQISLALRGQESTEAGVVPTSEGTRAATMWDLTRIRHFAAEHPSCRGLNAKDSGRLAYQITEQLFQTGLTSPGAYQLIDDLAATLELRRIVPGHSLTGEETAKLVGAVERAITYSDEEVPSLVATTADGQAIIKQSAATRQPAPTNEWPRTMRTEQVYRELAARAEPFEPLANASHNTPPTHMMYSPESRIGSARPPHDRPNSSGTGEFRLPRISAPDRSRQFRHGTLTRPDQVRRK